ncbi:MAG: putative DNA binding domain-containing protein [Bacteroidales bacterium]|nr:putative DNA binding domain-containing protein [Bacteroidales bacterium]
MTENELQQYLLHKYPQENAKCEWKEFKSLKNSFCGNERDDVISYVSAIANMEGGFLVVGVHDKTLEIVGTDTYNYDRQKAVLRLTERCTNLSSEGLEIEEFITEDTQKTVWVIHVPKHQPKRPVYAHNKAWQRIEDSLVELTSERLNTILSENLAEDDWSAGIIPGATIEDLDPQAIRQAREKYVELFPKKESEVASWDDAKFLNKTGFTVKGEVTRAAIIILGRKESEVLLTPSVCKIRYRRKKEIGGEDVDFEIFNIPMILAVEELGHRISNTQYVYTIEGNLFPQDMKRYDVFTLREPLNNAIAHQDYSKGSMIDVVEYEDEKLVFLNKGQFIPKSVEDVVTEDIPESFYRNRHLAETMRNVKMVDTEGGGIRKLYMQQKKRFFPMPEYDLTGMQVKCTIQGNVLDENFAKILVNNPDLSIQEILLLDAVQKHKPLTDDSINYLRKKKYIEGRKPHIYLSMSIAGNSKHVGLKTSYIKNKSFDDDYFRKLIVDYISTFHKASRKEIDELLCNKLSEALTERQKFDKITNLLSSLKRQKKIVVDKNRNWVLVK